MDSSPDLEEVAPALEIDLALRADCFLVGPTENAGELGLFVPSESPPELGEHRVFRIAVPGGGVLDVLGEISVHRQAFGKRRAGYIVSFVELDEEQKAALQAFARTSKTPVRISHSNLPLPTPRKSSGRFAAIVEVKESLDVEAHVTLDSDTHFFAGFTDDIGEGGVFVQSWIPKKVGDQLTLRMTLQDDEQPIDTVGEVRWVRPFDRSSDAPPGYGIAFLDLSPEDRRRIDKFLKQRKPLFYDDE
jgi:uncharacterized protein (TIGR02266 family)